MALTHTRASEIARLALTHTRESEIARLALTHTRESEIARLALTHTVGARHGEPASGPHLTGDQNQKGTLTIENDYHSHASPTPFLLAHMDHERHAREPEMKIG